MRRAEEGGEGQARAWEAGLSWLWAGLICAAAAGIEGLCVGRNSAGKLKELNQPWWSPPMWLWALIGALWYAICFTALARILPSWPQHQIPILLLVALMLANALVNIPLFRLHRLDIAFYFFAPYWLLLGAFLWSVRPLDSLTFTLFSCYAGYQLYAGAWGYKLWKLNPAET